MYKENIEKDYEEWFDIERFFFEIVVRNLFNLFPDDGFSSKLKVGEEGDEDESNELNDRVKMGCIVCGEDEWWDSLDDMEKNDAFEGDDCCA